MSNPGARSAEIPIRSRRRRTRPLSVVARVRDHPLGFAVDAVVVAVVVTGCLFGVLVWLVQPPGTEAERHLSQIDVRGYERVHDYIDPGTAPAEERAAVAVFVGPPDDNVLARVSGPGLVVKAEMRDFGFRDIDVIGHGTWHGCGVGVQRWKTSRPLLAYYELTAEQLAEFKAGRLSVLSVSVGCPR
jgi:hypothetical protein